MKTAVIILSVLLILAAFWIAALFAEKKNLLKDDNDNYVPDIIEDKVSDIKNNVNEKVNNVKTKIDNVKKALK